jgi:rubrerythrin
MAESNFSLDKFLELSRNDDLLSGNIEINSKDIEEKIRKKNSGRCGRNSKNKGGRRSKNKNNDKNNDKIIDKNEEREEISIEDILSIADENNKKKKYNICEQCNVPMQLQESFSYECPSCGVIFRVGEESCPEIMTIHSFDSKSAGRKFHSSYSCNADYSKIQRNVIKDFLTLCFDRYYGPENINFSNDINNNIDTNNDTNNNINNKNTNEKKSLDWDEEFNEKKDLIVVTAADVNNENNENSSSTIALPEVKIGGTNESMVDNFDGKKIPRNIIPIIVDRYMDIIKLELDNIDNDGVYIGKKKFVKRGNVKKEIIGALIYYECLGRHIPFNKKEIASLLFLPKEGIAHGEEIIRSLAAESKIILPEAENLVEDYIERYFISIAADLDELHPLRTNEAKECIKEIVSASRKYGIGINMIDTTRITGTIWFFSINVEEASMNYSVLEEACRGVKKNTFQRFSKDLSTKMDKVRPILEKWGFSIKAAKATTKTN